MFKIIIVVTALGVIRSIVNEIGDYASEINPYKADETEGEK